MNTLIKSLYVLFFMLFLYVCLIQSIRPVFLEPRIYGSERPPAFPPFSAEAWLEGSFQAGVESWLKARLGFRKAFIKTENEINYRFFKEVSRKEKGTQVVYGKDNTLFIEPYIKEYLNLIPDYASTLDDTSTKIKNLSDALEAEGVTLLVFIAPIKTFFMHEKIPSVYLKYKNQDEQNNYQRMIYFLEEKQVNYFDSYAFLTESWADLAHPVFSNSGGHWNRYGAWLCLEEAINQVSPMMRDAFPDRKISKIEYKRPYGQDRDLAGLINVWNNNNVMKELPYVDVELLNPAVTIKPDVLMVGTSFSDHLIKHLINFNLTRTLTYSGYWGKYEKIDKDNDPTKFADQELRAFLLEQDLIILESHMADLNYIGWGFLEHALRVLALP